MEGAPRPLGPALDASAFRIVQEAVTNVVRHAGGAPATVTVRYGPAALELVVADEGRAARRTPAAAATASSGCASARRCSAERSRRARATARGFEVRAVLPYADARMIRVLIADDQPLMRAGFKTVLEATGSIEVVAEAGDGEEAVRLAERHAPGRRADGHPHAGARRHRGDAPAARASAS